VARVMKVDVYVDPHVYFDVADLPDPFTVWIPVSITNNEDVTLYFRITLVNPPTGYSDYTKDLGSVGAGASKFFTYSFKRAQPSLVDGELDEDLLLRIEAYTDPDYTEFYGLAETSITVHYIDHNDPAWTVLYHDTFDDGTMQGWGRSKVDPEPALGRTNHLDVWLTSSHYISAPYSILFFDKGVSTNWTSLCKSFTVGAYNKAYIIIHYYAIYTFAIMIGNDLLVSGAVPKAYNKWIRLVLPLPVNTTTTVYIKPYQNARDRVVGYLDDVIVIAK